jgi:hypothetical protein
MALDPGATIKLKVRRRAHADLLDVALSVYADGIRRRDAHWEVGVRLDDQTNSIVIELFEVLSRWLAECNLASCSVQLGECEYTVLRAGLGAGSNSGDFQLERAIQLHMSLERSIVVEQAKGVIAALLDLPLEVAFERLTNAACTQKLEVHELAARVVEERRAPHEASPAQSRS